MTRAAFIRRNGGLHPVDDDGRALVAALPDKPVMVSIYAKRNARHHRLLFRLLEMVRDGGAWDGSADTLLDFLKIATGHVRTVVDPGTGRAVFATKSIAFDEMGQDAFRRWFDAAVQVICERLLNRADWESVRDEVIATVDKPWR